MNASSNNLAVATIQFKPDKGSVPKNRTEMINLCDEAVSLGAKVLVFPEMSLTGYLWPSPESIAPYSESAKGETFEFFSRYCKQNQCYLAYGFAERDGNLLFNSQNLISAEGELLATYRKVHLFIVDYNWAIPGNRGFCYVDTPLGRMGLGICMDLNYDDFIEFHIVNQTRWLLFSTNWLRENLDIKIYWRKRLRKFKETAFLANNYGFEENLEFFGNSSVLSSNRLISHAESFGNEILLTKHLYCLG